MSNCLLFDHDGVLVDTEPWYYEATRQAIAELGIDLDLPGYLERMASGTTSWELARANGVDEARIVAARTARDDLYRQMLQTRDIEIEGVLETLEELARTHRMAIVTTARRVDFELIHRERSIVDFFDTVVTVDDVARAKPHPDPYLEGMKRLGGEPSNSAAIEDSARGLRAAIAAGVDCAVVHNEFTATQDFSGAAAHLRSIRELPDWIEGRRRDG